MEIENEMGVIVRFAAQCGSAGWMIERIGPTFPDATIINIETGETFRAEFEYDARNFIQHGHDPRKCDVIICWINNWHGCPMTIMTLSDPGWGSTKIVPLDPKDAEILHLKIENSRLRHRISKLEQAAEESKPTITYEQYVALNETRNEKRNGGGSVTAKELVDVHGLSQTTAYRWVGKYESQHGKHEQVN